jgi:hypothetical protein
MGIRDSDIRDPRVLRAGFSVAGPALTMQCMPNREVLYGDKEYDNPETKR